MFGATWLRVLLAWRSDMLHHTIYCRSRNLLSLGIRVFDGMRQWSHVAGILSDGKTVVEARAFSGVITTPLSEVIDRSSQWIIVDRELPFKHEGDVWALGTVGARYDWGGAIGTPWYRGWQEEGQWFCSEHETRWQEIGGRTVFRLGTRSISPNNSFMVL